MNEKTDEMSYGFASKLRDALANASFIGFTGTHIEKTDANTRAVFADYISIYDVQRAVADKATVPIYYESRISKLSLNAAELPKLDAEFEEITEGEELTKKEKLKTKWTGLVVATLGYWRQLNQGTVNNLSSAEFVNMGHAPSFSDTLVQVTKIA